jgi:putative sigma-54 modulation protein
MQVKITARHVNLSDKFKAHVDELIDRTLACFPRIESVHVIIDKQKISQFAEINVQGSNHIRIDAKAEGETKYEAFDSALTKVEVQLRKMRDRVQEHKCVGLGEIEATV